MALTGGGATLDKLLAAMTASTAQRKSFFKLQVNAGVQGYWNSLWTEPGGPAAGATPQTFNHNPNGGEVVTKSTTGAIPGLADPAGADVLYLARACLESDAPFGWFLADRLWQCSGFATNITTTQSISGTPPALTRPDANGNGVEMWLEWYAAGGATPTTVTVVYTNQAGVGSRSAVAVIPASPTIGSLMPCRLQAGDTGVQSIQSLSLTPSTGSASNMGVTLLRRLVTVHAILREGGYAMPFSSSLPVVDTGACLFLATLTGNLVTGVVTGRIGIIEG